MLKYNINDVIYIQITEEGWEHLRETLTSDYIKHCIEAKHHKKEINGEIWYRLQCHVVFNLLPISSHLLFKPTVMFEDKDVTKD